jgi:hypothetical protein
MDLDNFIIDKTKERRGEERRGEERRNKAVAALALVNFIIGKTKRSNCSQT